MLILSCSSKLQLLEGMLKKCLPQALQVHGVVRTINRGNPMGHEVIVDSWPTFRAVLTRPRQEVISDNSDIFANVYTAFYLDLDAYRTLLLDTDAVNWNQTFRVQGHQDGIYHVSQDAVAIKQVSLLAASFITYVHPNPAEIPEHKLAPGFTISSLNASHVDLVDKTWAYGGSEQSYRYLAKLVQNFISVCILDPNGETISWAMMDPIGSLAVGYTMPNHRGKFYGAVAGRTLAMKAHASGFPVYGNVVFENVHSQRIQEHRGYNKLSELFHFCIHAKK